MLGAELRDGASVLDLGCGDGALAAWLLDVRGIRVSVHGLDAMEEMIDVARARTIDAATFDVCNLVDSDWPVVGIVDVVVLSGTLNTMEPVTARQLLQLAWTCTGVALVFNFLGDAPSASWRGRDLGPARRHSVDAMTGWARSQCSQVDSRSDYLDGHDVTICMRRKGDDQP